jgi:hypothetical protein
VPVELVGVPSTNILASAGTITVIRAGVGGAVSVAPFDMDAFGGLSCRVLYIGFGEDWYWGS